MKSCSSPQEAGLSVVDDAGAVRRVPMGSRGDGPLFGWHLFELEKEKGQGQDPHFCACPTWLGNFWICLTLIRRQNNEVIPVPLQKLHAAVNSTLSDRHGEGCEFVLSVTFIWWVRLWQGADLLFNILGGFFWCVGNMFAEILGVKQDVFICFDGFLWRHNSAFHTYPALSILNQHQDELSNYPVCLWRVGLFQSEKGRAGKDLQASKLTAELNGVFPSPWLPLSCSKQRWWAVSKSSKE